MNWFDYLLIGLWAFGALTSVATVEKPKKPNTPTTAAIIVALDALLVVGLLFSRGVL